MKKKYILVVLVVAFLGYGIWSSGLYMFLRGYLQNSEPTVSEVFPPTEYYPSLRSNVKAVVLIVHGLNLKPSKMSDLGTFLQESDFEVYTANLSGHRGSFDDHKIVTRAIWLEDFYGAYKIASARASELKIPIYFLGFSHGAVLGLDALLSKEDVKIEKMILECE